MRSRRWPILILALWVSGCSWLIPDREKEYLGVQPLPPLKLPPDLTRTDTPTLESIRPPSVIPSQPPAVEAPKDSAASAHFIELAQPYSESWLRLIKALDQLGIEITHHDAERGVLNILHSSTEEELGEDQGMWEDFLYFFTGEGKLHEREYQLLLTPAGDHTRLYVLDSDGHPSDDSQTLKLLERLQQSLAKQTNS